MEILQGLPATQSKVLGNRVYNAPFLSTMRCGTFLMPQLPLPDPILALLVFTATKVLASRAASLIFLARRILLQ